MAAAGVPTLKVFSFIALDDSIEDGLGDRVIPKRIEDFLIPPLSQELIFGGMFWILEIVGRLCLSSHGLSEPVRSNALHRSHQDHQHVQIGGRAVRVHPANRLLE
jgi:hypothetical protein